MPLSNCTINLIVTWSVNCVVSEGNKQRTFATLDTILLRSYNNFINPR